MRPRSREGKKVAPGTRAADYRCSLPGLAGFVCIASPRAVSVFSTFSRRRERDSNPRYLSIHTISNRAPSATRASLQGGISNVLGGEGGIRTPGTVAGTPDFESGAIDQALPPLH